MYAPPLNEFSVSNFSVDFSLKPSSEKWVGVRSVRSGGVKEYVAAGTKRPPLLSENQRHSYLLKGKSKSKCKMPNIKLYYGEFPFWRAEVSRLALHLGKVRQTFEFGWFGWHDMIWKLHDMIGGNDALWWWYHIIWLMITIQYDDVIVIFRPGAIW